MSHLAFHLHAAEDDRRWPGWDSATTSGPKGQSARSLAPRQKKTLVEKVGAGGHGLAVLALAEAPSNLPSLVVGHRHVPLQRSPQHPALAFAAVDFTPGTSIALAAADAKVDPVLLLDFYLLPLPGHPGLRPTSLLGRFGRKIAPRQRAWSPADFPWSHFDGLAYLQQHGDVANAVLARKCRSALHHYEQFGRSEGRPFPFAILHPPNPGSPLNLANSLRTYNSLEHRKLQESQQKLKELETAHQELATRHTSLVTSEKDLAAKHRQLVTDFKELEGRYASQRTSQQTQQKNLTEENELLLLQLHQVQEELEQYFLENRKLQESQQKLKELEKNHQEVVTRHTSLITSEKDLATRISALEAEHSDLVTEREALQSDHSSLSILHSSLVAERDDLATRHSSLVTALEEVQGQHSSLSAERDASQIKAKQAEDAWGVLAQERDALQARVKEIEGAAGAATKERDQARVEREAAAKERDTLKKTVSDRAIRIAELEAQVADQAERQKQIDEGMAKAEGQLEMLKELLRPALT